MRHAGLQSGSQEALRELLALSPQKPPSARNSRLPPSDHQLLPDGAVLVFIDEMGSCLVVICALLGQCAVVDIPFVLEKHGKMGDTSP